MRHLFSACVGATLAATLATTCAFAHAFLDRAMPGVGATVGTGPSELELTFTQDVVPALSGVTLATAGGGSVATAKPVPGPANTLHVKLGRALGPGTYVVSWHVVSVDTHPTSGKYRFIVAP